MRKRIPVYIGNYIIHVRQRFGRRYRKQYITGEIINQHDIRFSYYNNVLYINILIIDIYSELKHIVKNSNTIFLLPIYYYIKYIIAYYYVHYTEYALLIIENNFVISDGRNSY